MRVLVLCTVLFGLIGAFAGRAQEFETDVVPTTAGDLEITFIGHGTLMFRIGGAVIHVDPVGAEADYSSMPDADLILLTHDHGDHLDPGAIGQITRDGTVILTTETCAARLGDIAGVAVMKNGDTREAAGISIEAVPAYNITNERSPGQPFHPKGTGNGYVLTFGGTRVYVAGDTENTPEMKALTGIDVAFLPMNLPYTMTPEMVADAAVAFRPHILYPYHFGNTDTSGLVKLLADEKDIEVRIRAME